MLAIDRCLDLLSQQLSYEVLTLLEDMQHCYSLYLVGGSVRDLLLQGTLSHDLDFEIHYLGDGFNVVEEQKKVYQLLKKNSLGNVVEELAYSIMRLQIDDWSLEFSFPRKELFIDGRFDHKNFECELLATGRLSEVWRRRDFSINALGIKFEHGRREFVDPFNGIMAIEDKLLIPCSDDFYLDPVRLLRAVRFRVRFNFNFSSSLEAQFRKMNLEALSIFYLFNEAFKSEDVIAFFKLFFILVDGYHLKLPEKWNSLRILQKLSYREFSSIYEIIFYLIKEQLVNQETLLEIARLVQINLKQVKYLSTLQMDEEHLVDYQRLGPFAIFFRRE